MISKIKKISIVLISYNSSKKLLRFIKKIPKQTPILIVDNSRDFKLKQIFKKNKNISIYFKKNEGYGASINYAVKKIKTEYFFVVQPDVSGITKNSLITFYNYAKKLNDKFSVIGPHFRKSPKKGHFQTNLKLVLFMLLVSTVSQLGDIIVSYFKRLSQIKDTGKIIPGHGGLLDRIDGMIFAIPFSYLILKINIF